MEGNGQSSGTQSAAGVTAMDYLRFIRQRWWVIVLVVAIVTGVTWYFASRQTPQYSASAELIHQSAGFESTLLGIADMSYVYQASIPVDARLIRSPDLAAKVKQRIGYAGPAGALLGMISTTPVPDTESIVVKATSTDPNEAATVANGFADTFVATRSEDLNNALAAAKAVLESQLAQIPADQQEGATAQALGDRLKQLNVMDQMALADYRVIQPASAPSVPFSPRPMRDTLLAFAISLIAAIGLVLVLQYSDKRVRDEQAMEHAFGVPVLASIPRMRRKRLRKTGPRSPVRGSGLVGIGFYEEQRALLEPYLMLCSKLKYFGVDKDMRVLMVTSTFPQQGKTTVSINLALALALTGERVLLIECDMRRPKIHEYLGLDNTIGLANVLAGTASLVSAAHAVDLSDWAPTSSEGKNGGPKAAGRKLNVICAGPTPPNPSELVASQRMVEVLEAATRSRADHVILDTPPVLLVADPLAVGQNVDGVIISARLGKIKRGEAEQARTLLEQSGAHLLGLVVGSERPSKQSYYRYGHGYVYGYGYGQGDGDESAKDKAGGRRPGNEQNQAPQEGQPVSPLSEMAESVIPAVPAD